MTKRTYALKPDPADERDLLFSAPSRKLPEEVDLRPLMSPVVDQGQLGSCTANAIASGLREYYMIASGQPVTDLSRLYLYYKEREIEGSINEDAGAYIRDGMKVLQKIGCAPEVDWPYDISRFTEQPSAQAEQDAAAYKISDYHRIIGFDRLQSALAHRKPVVIGIKVYDSFESTEVARTGMVPVPDPAKEQMLGGHAVLVVGYKQIDGQTYAIVRNSWGEGWGDKGYFYLPKDFFTAGYVTDMWTANLNAQMKAEGMTFQDAIAHFVSVGAFVDPVFWVEFEEKYKAGELVNDDFEWVFRGFQVMAARDINLNQL